MQRSSFAHARIHGVVLQHEDGADTGRRRECVRRRSRRAQRHFLCRPRKGSFAYSSVGLVGEVPTAVSEGRSSQGQRQLDAGPLGASVLAWV